MSDIAATESSTMRYGMQKRVNSDPVISLLNILVVHNKIREMDRSFALFVNDNLGALPAELALSDADSLDFVALCALTSEQLSRQHVCLEIAQIAQPWLPHFSFPPEARCKQILCSDAFKALGLMVFDGERLYLQRYWQYEQQVVKQVQSFAAPMFKQQDISDNLSKLYPEQNEAETAQREPDWQKTAIALACLNSVTVIAGGPGTGKTTTVVRILWSLSKLYQQTGKSNAIIKMVAPTGKAAARLSESVSGAVAKLPDVADNIPRQCSTIHRLLGVVPNSVFFRHNQQHLLNIDVLVVDEASMIDLPLLAKLLSALPSHCRVILLGDSHQLASVEVGSVFSDICRLKGEKNTFSMEIAQALQAITRQPIPVQSRQEASGGTAKLQRSITDNIVFLTRSWRFHADSGIGRLAQAVNAGHVINTFSVLGTGRQDIRWHSQISEQILLDLVLPHFESLHLAANQEDVAKAFELLGLMQILTVQRSGKWGLHHINLLIKQALVKKGFIDSNAEFYPGRPIMISSNDYQNQLFNGDVGLVIIDAEIMQRTGRRVFKVCFQDVEKGYRTLLPAQLPEHETMFAITTHKSQGSEFEKVIFCLPENRTGSGNELLNRELLYTGITRAKSEFVLFGDKNSVSRAVNRVCKRASGLASVLGQHAL